MKAQRIVPPATAFSKSPSRKQRKPRIEDGQHLKWIRSLPCLVTGRRDGVEAAHIRYGDPIFGKRPVGIGERSDDRWTIPLHAEQHRDQHATNERDWWLKVGIDPVQVAAALWGVTGDDEAAELILREHREKKGRT